MQSGSHSPSTPSKTAAAFLYPEEELSFQESYENFLKDKKAYEDSLPDLHKELKDIEAEVTKFEETSNQAYENFILKREEIMPKLKSQREEIRQLVNDIKEELDEKFKFLENLPSGDT